MKQHKRPLEKVFTSVTPSYDRMNKLLTLGMDRGWRRRAVSRVLQGAPPSVLDLCTGTGDFAKRVSEIAAPGTRIAALDYSQPMLDAAREKLPEEVTLTLGDAADMPFDDSEFDAIGISFAFRNLVYKNPKMEQALLEIRRVLKEGGVFVIVESSQPGLRLLRFLRDRYVDFMVKRLAGRMSGHRGAYYYLAESVKGFYFPFEIEELLRGAGFSTVAYHPLFFGAAGIHVAS